MTNETMPSDPGSNDRLGAAVIDALNDCERLKCPHCNEPFTIKRSASLPASQRMTFKIEHEHPLLSMKTVYGTLEAIEKTLRATARDFGADCHVFLEGVDCEPGSTSFRLFIADNDVKKKPKTGAKRQQPMEFNA